MAKDIHQKQEDSASDENLIRFVDLLVKMDQPNQRGATSDNHDKCVGKPYLIKNGVKIIL